LLITCSSHVALLALLSPSRSRVPLEPSSANQLAEAADKLTGAVKSFRLLADEEPPREQAAD